MNSHSLHLHSWWRILVLSTLIICCSGLNNTDKILLLSFKQSVVSDPLGVLKSWNSNDRSPCSWNGVSCGTPGMGNAYFRVVGLSLPNSNLLCSLPANLGMIQHLRILNLANNWINGSLPWSLFSAFELQTLDLSGNLISGGLPELVGGLKNLQFLNLSDNALSGKIPENLTALGNLTVVSLTNNYFSGSLLGGLQWVEFLDLSSNLINGSLPSNFTGSNLRYFNVSYNRLSGEIPTEFSNQVPTNATIDLSFNNFTGEIPQTSLFLNQAAESYSGNAELCGKPLDLCPIPSTISTPPNASAPTTSTPAIAAIPNTTSPSGSGRSGIRPAKTAAIVVGDILGVAVLSSIIFLVYKLRRKKNRVTNLKTTKPDEGKDHCDWASTSSAEESQGIRALACLRKQPNGDEESSSETSSSDGEEIEDGPKDNGKKKIVMVDGEKEMEVETLLKASAYVLGATSSSIVYKAVLEDGTPLAIRRIGESGVERFRDFENQVRVIAKMVHPNLVRIRGFYWGADEKLVLHDFVPNGSLANARYRKVGSSSPCHHLPWEVRLKIARGVARGLNYIHDKKHVHGNLKPSNILLGSDMEPKIGDFGLERLVVGESGYKAGGSAQNHSSRRSTASRDSFQDTAIGAAPSPSPSSMGCISPYYAPESLRSLKPNAKWDVYSFGVVLLELLTGKVLVSDELGVGPAPNEPNRALRMCDVAIRAELEGKEDALLALFKVGFSCVVPVPHKRPPMKEVLQALAKFPPPSSSSSSSCSYSYGPQ